MKLFDDVREKLGREGVQLVRKWEKTSSQIANHRNHLKFNLRCRDLDVIPTSLRLRSTVKSEKARTIIRRAEKQLLRERINLTTRRIHTLKRNEKIVEKTLLERCQTNGVNNEDIFQAAKSLTQNKAEASFQKSKQRQLDKLKKLSDKKQEKKIRKDEPDMSGTQLKRWVKVLSQ